MLGSDAKVTTFVATAPVEELHSKLLVSSTYASPESVESADPPFFATTEALALLGVPALVFDETRVVLVWNCLIKMVSAFVRLRADNTITFVDLLAETQFRKSVAALDTGSSDLIQVITPRCSEAGTATIARILPIRRFPKHKPRAGLLVFAPLTLPRGPPVEFLQSLFGFTPAEARVARGLALGATIDDLASSANVSRNTVRTQLRSIMEKTGCHRQAEAVGMFCKIAVIGYSAEMAVV
jgi:DNA-binding CsgD family transcriptional regulator